jgi:hypothetical protein
MKVNWLLQRGIFDENLLKICKIINNQGMRYEVIDHNEFEFNQFKDDDCVIFYGSIEMMQKIQKKKKWVPGGWCNFKNFKCTSYYPYLGDYLLNRNYIILPLYEMIKQKDFICNIFQSDKLFIKSNNGTKEIEGQVISKNNLNFNSFDLEFQYFNDISLLMIISSLKKIEKEWRLVIANKKVITGSQYKTNYELEVSNDCPQEVIDFGNEIAKEWQPDNLFTMDICKSSGKLKLLEINSFSCAGLYDCKLDVVINEASKLAIEEWKEYQKIEEVAWPKGYERTDTGKLTKITK